MIDFLASFNLSDLSTREWAGLMATAVSVGVFTLIALIKLFTN